MGRYALVTVLSPKTSTTEKVVGWVEATSDDRKLLRELRRRLDGTFETVHHRYARSIVDTTTSEIVR